MHEAAQSSVAEENMIRVDHDAVGAILGSDVVGAVKVGHGQIESAYAAQLVVSDVTLASPPRKLASVQVVDAVEPIEGADLLERVRVLGWWVVAKKGEHKPGDKIVYCEIDSLLPERPEFEFLRKGCYKPLQLDAAGNTVMPAGFRIRTIRLRGQVSQGICFPTSILPPGTPDEVGDDVTQALSVAKWEPAQPTCFGRHKGSFPDFIGKTDETRVQLLGSVLSRCAGEQFHLTEKLDGTSFTAFLRDGVFGVCSRNLLLDESDTESTLVQLSQQLDIKGRLTEAVRRLGFDVAIQGEVVGPGIQKNKYGLTARRLYVFNVIDIAKREILEHEAARAVVKEMGLDSVPSLGSIYLSTSEELAKDGYTNHVDELVDMAVGVSALCTGVPREGIVLRPAVPRREHATGGRFSFKAINPKFLLKFDE